MGKDRLYFCSGAQRDCFYRQQTSRSGNSFQFHLMEATIPDVHRAIREGQITCSGLVEAYIKRAKRL